jgi:glycosyltransferase involved in cell wall biosynthesis
VRVLHAATFDKVAGGNLDQLRAEHRAVARLGIPWDVLVWSKDEPTEPFMRRIPSDCGPVRRRFTFMREILRLRSGYDAVLIRYDPNNPFLLWLGRHAGFWVSEHHAIEFLEQRVRGTLKARVLASMEKLFGRMLLSTCAGVVAVTEEILRYQQSRIRKALPGHVMPNGFDVEGIEPAADERGGVPKLFFVATNFLPWHGLVEVLKSLADYTQPIELHLVGNIGPDLMQQIESHPRRSQIVVHGFVNSSTIPALLATGDLCLSAFNSMVTGLSQASRLKVRHMLALGVPVIGGEADTSFPPGFRFYAQVPAPDLSVIVAHALEWRSAKRVEIRAAAAPYIDKAAIVQEQYLWLKALVGK